MADITGFDQAAWECEKGRLGFGTERRTSANGAADAGDGSATGEANFDKSKPIDATRYIWREPCQIEPRAWLYGYHLVRKFASCTVAPAGVGKSSLALAEVLAMVTGKPLLGVEPADGPLRVWYWNGEDPREEIDRRVAAIALHYGITEADIGGRLFIDSGRDMEIVIASQTVNGVAVATPVIDALNATIARHRIDVIQIDPFISCHRVPENDNGAIDRVTKSWAGIAERGNCGVELIHHVRKGGSGSGEYQVDDARGAVAMTAAVRSARVLNVMSKDEADKAGINPGERRLHFRIDSGKANLAPPPEKSEWRKLVGVSLGNDRGGRPADNVQVVTTWCWPDDRGDVSVHDLIELQRRISKGNYRQDPRAADWVGNLVAEGLGFDLKDRSAKASIRVLLQSWIVSGALREVERRDEKRRTRRFVEVGIWAIP